MIIDIDNDAHVRTLRAYSTTTTRDAIERAMHALRDRVYDTTRDAHERIDDARAYITLRDVRDQRGCEHLEGFASLCDTIDVIVFG